MSDKLDVLRLGVTPGPTSFARTELPAFPRSGAWSGNLGARLGRTGGPAIERPDVVVVGAGISGLAAALSLTNAGLDVALLEGRDRVGGRLLSLPVAEFGLDVGATWFWPGESRVQALVDRMRIAIHPQYLTGNAVYHDPRGTQTIDGNPIDVPSHRFVAGAQALAESVAQALPAGVLHLSHPVSQIVQTEEGVAAVGVEKTFAAKHVLLSVPPALAISSITFEPALPDSFVRVAQHTPVWMGGTTKVVARYSTPFWRARGLAGAGISHVGPLREVHDMSGPDGVPAMLFGFAPPMRVGAPTPSSEQVLAQLFEMFGSEAAAPLQLVIHDWRQERFTSPKRVEALDAYHLYGHPLYASPVLGDRVHWASTETAPESPGHIEGALAAADRAAQTVIVALGSGA